MSVPHLERLLRECQRSDTQLAILPGAAAAQAWASALRQRWAEDVDGEGFEAVRVLRAAAVIAETGSIVLHGGPGDTRRASLCVRNLIVLVDASRVHGDLHTYLAARDPQQLHRELGSHLTLITGPSRTADIEKVLVVPAHGPARLWLGVVDGERQGGDPD
ncbi:MAG: LUD domain-containing protein [Pseudomonadota bacterium]